MKTFITLFTLLSTFGLNAHADLIKCTVIERQGGTETSYVPPTTGDWIVLDTEKKNYGSLIFTSKGIYLHPTYHSLTGSFQQVSPPHSGLSYVWRSGSDGDFNQISINASLTRATYLECTDRTRSSAQFNCARASTRVTL
jgi:hypothetical protein